jgi:CheY-like chemotaxis protein
MKEDGQRSFKILVVDDESSVCQAIKMLLKHDGHEVQVAASGPEALTLFAAGGFDLVITDYSMQDMKGDELAGKLKKLQPGLPIIMATAFAADLQASGSVDEDVNLILNKPFSLTELRQAVADVMH